MGRPKKENSLTQQDIVEAAIACIEKEGESALGVNRVARELGIKPPAIYKHLNGNAGLKKAVVLAIYRRFFNYFSQKTFGLNDPRAFLQAGGQATRDFARLHPGLYRVMTQFQLQPEDPESALIIKESQTFFKAFLWSEDINEAQLIDIMRMTNSAIVGFITLEQSGLLTLPRSTNDSFEVMLDALFVAIEHLRKN
ncbi:Transcriptional regulator [Hyella patelloides LEGE 07179]|uniref:Transcriptional regulator n=1 Tax=Hyella patelloides LEGE 07179 TaxID=945734 RepID=A0A563VXM1_9CYAN|nr:TetR/AcrR family transcriptional regulator [Hyella patelloides]VEP16137.1 Transcriptional regulator [Hyella patelloides LEGE 07179]